MEYLWFVASGIIIGLLIWQLMKGGKIGLIGGITLSIIGVLFGGFIFPKLGITISGLFLGIIFVVLGALATFSVMRLIIRKQSN